MTTVARGGGHYMVGAFAGGYSTVVAILAGIGGLCVVDGHDKRTPARTGGVATVAGVGGVWMGATLAAGGGAVVAAAALIGGLGVINGGQRRPHVGVVAGVAQITG